MSILKMPIISWFWLIIKSIAGIFSRLYCRTRRKSSSNLKDEDGPISITVVNQGASNNRNTSQGHVSHNIPLGNDTCEGENKFVDWNAWNDNTAEDNTLHDDDANLFEDMEPQLTKPKMVRIAKSSSLQKSNESFHTQNRLSVDTSAMHVQTELGAWVDDQPGWDDETIEESEISEEAQNILREKRKAEKQRRAMEQKRKKEEQRLGRADKKSTHLGIKVN